VDLLVTVEIEEPVLDAPEVVAPLDEERA
jgi:hypothetical protein